MLSRLSGTLQNRVSTSSRIRVKSKMPHTEAIWSNGPVEVRKSPIQGLGVFANADVTKGTVVEVCPTLGFTRKSISAADSTSSAVEGTRLEDYVYEFPGECSHLNDDRILYLPLGFGSLYNHSDKPNLRYNIERTIDGRHVVMVMKATEDIPAGSELCVSYGDQWWWERMQQPVSGYSTHMFRKSIMEKARSGAVSEHDKSTVSK